MKKSKKINRKLVYLIIIALITTSLSMARYMDIINGNITAKTAKFSFKVNESTNEIFEINLADTLDPTADFSQKDTVISPNTNGNFKIELDATDIQTAFEYTIKISKNENTEIPKELILYNAENHTIIDLQQSDPTSKENYITKSVTLQDIQSNPVISHEIEWIWQLNKDRDETRFEGKEICIDIEIEIKQVY